MYLQSVMNSAKTFGPVKAASAAIAFYQKINLYAHEPTQSPAVCIVRSAATRKFGLNAKNQKEPFEWDDVVGFAVAYGLRQLGYCHLVVAAMSVLMFGAMCRYDDASGLQWRNVRFLADRSAYELSFDKRKNAQFRQGNKVMVASAPLATICPVRMMLALKEHTGGSEDSFVFRGFIGRLVSKTPGRTAPGPEKIKYDQFLHYMCLWFSGVMGLSVAAFRKHFATQSGRSGGASAASNAGVPAELWAQQGDWKSWDAQKRYMKTNPTRLLSVSRAAMGLLRYPAPEEGIGGSGSIPPGAVEGIGGSGSVPPGAVEEILLPDVVGVPEGAFVWT
jgi:hypothetical protein